MSSILNVYTILISGKRATVAHFIFDGGRRVVPRFTGYKKPEPDLAVKNATAQVATSYKRPTQKDLDSIYKDWDQGKEKENLFLITYAIPEIEISFQVKE